MIKGHGIAAMSLYLISYALIIAVVYVVAQLLSKGNNYVKYYWRIVLLVVFTHVIATVWLPIVIMDPKNVKHCRNASRVLKRITRIVGIEWTLRRGHILSEDRGCVVVANHQSILDLLGMFNIWEVMGKVTTIAKKAVFYMWPFGLSAYLGGVVFIDRNDPKDSYNKLNVAKDLMIRDRTKIWMFPEGTRNAEGILPFKRGAFKVAILAQVPVIPVVFSPYYFIDRNSLSFKTGRVIITCLDPIETKGRTMDDIDDVIKQTREVMIDCYKDVSDEVNGSKSNCTD